MTSPIRLRVFGVSLFALALAIAALLGASEGWPSWSMLGLFAALMVYGENRAVEMPNGTMVGPGFMISMAAVVAFNSEHSLLGPLLVGMASGIWLAHLKERAWILMMTNAAIIGLANLAAAAGYSILPSSVTDHVLATVIGAIVPVVFYVCVLWVLVGTASVLRGTDSFRHVLHGLLPETAQFLPFALVGIFLGRLYLALGAAVLLLIIVPILIAREMFASYMRVKETHEETVGMLIRALEAKDRYTAGHAERVANYARYMGEELNFMPARLERLRFAALMHDIGKLVVPNQLLNKPGRLTPEEFARVRIHEKVSVKMLSHIDFLAPIAHAAHSDNTKFDPDDEDHPIEPYIVMIADAYDAMTSTRSYRKALPQDTAFQELRDKAGIQFHPECVEALIRSLETRGEKHGAGFEQQDEFADAPDAGVGSAGLGDLLPSESPGA